MIFCPVTFFLVWILVKSHTNRPYPSHMTFCLVTFFLVWILVKSQTDRQTDRHTDCDAYEPTVHTHRWAQKSRDVAFVLETPSYVCHCQKFSCNYFPLCHINGTGLLDYKVFTLFSQIIYRAHEGESECRASTWNFAQCPVSTWEWDCQCRAEVECQVLG